MFNLREIPSPGPGPDLPSGGQLRRPLRRRGGPGLGAAQEVRVQVSGVRDPTIKHTSLPVMIAISDIGISFDNGQH